MYNHIQLNEPMVPRYRLMVRAAGDRRTIIQVYEFEEKQKRRVMTGTKKAYPYADLSDLQVIGYVGHRDACDCCNKCKEVWK